MGLESFNPFVPKSRQVSDSEFKEPTSKDLSAKFEVDCGCDSSSKVYIPLRLIFTVVVEVYDSGTQSGLTRFKTDPTVENAVKLKKNELENLIKTLRWDGTIPFNVLYAPHNLEDYSEAVESIRGLL